MCRLQEQKSKSIATTNNNSSPLLCKRPSTCSVLRRRSSTCSVLSIFQDKYRAEGNNQLSRSSSSVSINFELFLLDIGSKRSSNAFRPTSAIAYDSRTYQKSSAFDRRSSLPILQNNIIGKNARSDKENTNQIRCNCGTNSGSLNGQQLSSSFFNLWSRKDVGKRILGRQDPVWTRSSIYRSCGCHTGEYIKNEKIMAKKQLKCHFH